MNVDVLIDRVLDDEGLTAGLADAEAMLLVRTVTDRVRQLAGRTPDPASAKRKVDDLCRHAREIARKAANDPNPSAALHRLLSAWPAD